MAEGEVVEECLRTVATAVMGERTAVEEVAVSAEGIAASAARVASVAVEAGAAKVMGTPAAVAMEERVDLGVVAEAVVLTHFLAAEPATAGTEGLAEVAVESVTAPASPAVPAAAASLQVMVLMRRPVTVAEVRDWEEQSLWKKVAY